MPRQLRREYAGAIYHVMNRGDRREDIFLDDEDRHRLLDSLGEACQKTEWQIQSYCLMPNHFHLVLQTPQPNLVAGMKWLLGVYTRRFNIRHRLCGHLFGGRYKALIVDGGGNGYLQKVCDYVHLNPARARLINQGAALETFGWSSYPDYLKPAGKRPPWLRVDRLLGEKGIARDSVAGRREFGRQMEQRRLEESGADYRQIRGGWCLGDPEFRTELLADAVERVGPSHYSADRRETEEARAERIVRAGLKELDWKDGELAKRPKGDEQKVKLARQLRAETTMTLKWIAVRLQMGRWTSVSNLLRKKAG